MITTKVVHRAGGAGVTGLSVLGCIRRQSADGVDTEFLHFGASTLGFERYAGDSGKINGMRTLGASAPLKELQHKFGGEPERAVATAKELLGRA